MSGECPPASGSSDTLERIFNRRRADGSFYYSDDEVRNVLPATLLASSTPEMVAKLDDAVLRMVAQFLVEIGLNPQEAAPDTFCVRLKEHWKAHPPNAELMQELRDIGIAPMAVSRGTQLRRFADMAWPHRDAAAEGSCKNTPTDLYSLRRWKR